MAKDGLTKQDELFIDEYFHNGFNATKAYMKVFKTDVKSSATFCAYRLMNKSFIKLEIEKRWLEIKDLNIIKREEIIISLKTLMDNAIEENDSATLLKTIDMINKMTGAYTIQIDAHLDQNITLTIPGLESEKESDDE